MPSLDTAVLAYYLFVVPFPRRTYKIMAEHVDVLICGSGSAGICAATWLARCGLRCKILELKPGPLEIGKADGVQCRTVEVFESFGIAEEMLREAYHVLEVNFWGANEDGNLVWTGRTADTAPGLSHQPHVILNQARVNGLLLNAMNRFNGQRVDYGYNVKGVQVDSRIVGDFDVYPVTVIAEKDGAEETFKAKYALVCVFQTIHNINSDLGRLAMVRIALCAGLLATR